MTKPLWVRKIPKWSEYSEDIKYLSDPSLDLIERFKEQIVTYDNLQDHSDYVQCDNVERSRGHLLFILGNRVELIIVPNESQCKIYFIKAYDIGSI